jgi:prephenate dehydrogenase
VVRFGTVSIVGVGLIGGSIGRALRESSRAERVVGIGRNASRLAVGIGAVDEATTDLAEGVAGADVVVVCTPVSQVADYVIRAAEHGPRGVLITDAGSTKRTIVEAVERDDRARRTFVAAHPLAGSERSGVGFAEAGLFEGRMCVLTPTPRTPSDRLERARAFWSAVGCRLAELDPAAHDETLALTSHLPHAVAAALAGTIPRESLRLAAGAYRDGTRVAGADGALWAAIFHENRAALLRALDRFDDRLRAFRCALEADDTSALIDWWDVGRIHRSAFRFDLEARTTESGTNLDAEVEH